MKDLGLSYITYYILLDRYDTGRVVCSHGAGCTACYDDDKDSDIE